MSTVAATIVYTLHLYDIPEIYMMWILRIIYFETRRVVSKSHGTLWKDSFIGLRLTCAAYSQYINMYERGVNNEIGFQTPATLSKNSQIHNL